MNFSSRTSLKGISPYIFGTTRIGDDTIPFEERVKVALAAMDAGVWFHTSHTYGSALKILNEAFSRKPEKIPKLIIKIGWHNINELRGVIEENIKPLGLSGVQLGQLCMQDNLADDFANGGECYKVFHDFKNEGLVQGFVVEVFPWTSDAPLKALRAGYTAGIIDGFIFYLNPLQRFATNELWEEIVERDEPVIAMRTVSGGPVYNLRDVPGFAWKDYLQKRAAEVAPIFEKSGINNWTEFCVRFAHSFPQVAATVGSSAKLDNLNEFLISAKHIEPLDKEIINEIIRLQYRWSEETDVKAEKWTM